MERNVGRNKLFDKIYLDNKTSILLFVFLFHNQEDFNVIMQMVSNRIEQISMKKNNYKI